MSSVQGVTDDDRDRQKDRGDENGDGDVAFLQLFGEIDLRRQPVDHTIGDEHQYDAKYGVDEVQADDLQLRCRDDFADQGVRHSGQGLYEGLLILRPDFAEETSVRLAENVIQRQR